MTNIKENVAAMNAAEGDMWSVALTIYATVKMSAFMAIRRLHADCVTQREIERMATCES
jgi:hypothetical protein